MIINCARYCSGRRQEEVDLHDDAAFDGDRQGFVWIGLQEPDETLLRRAQSRFALHDLAVEDAHQAHQRPKVEIYGDSLFLVLRNAAWNGTCVDFGETHVFAGRGHVVTVRHGMSPPYVQVRERAERAEAGLVHGEGFVVYALLDFVVDCYAPVVQALEAEVDAVERAVFAHRGETADVQRAYDLRYELMQLRRTIAPLQEMCGRLMRFDTPLFSEELRPYLRDVQDHVIQLVHDIDDLRELLSAALESNMLLASVEMTDTTKKLAAWAAILAVPTAVAGIYGMNFDVMPELRQPLGYPAVLLAIGLACGLLYQRFRKARWL